MESYEQSIRTSPTALLLPPCRVCGAKASGLHYGVNTCEACKRFFCRIVRTGVDRNCMQQQKCEARPGGRSKCSYCRYHKCIRVGMSIEGQQMGRYTTKQRTQNTLEAKGLLDTKIDEILPEAPFEDPVDSLGNNQMMPNSEFEGSDVVEKRGYLSAELKSTIEQVCAASKQYSLIWFPFHRDKDIWDKEVEFCRNRNREIDEYGYAEPFQNCTGNNHYMALGIDTTSERYGMLVFTFHLEVGIRKAIKYAKCIPGFKRLPLDDQANLVKYSRFELWLTMCFSRINTKLNVAMALNGSITHREDMEHLFSKNYIANIYKMVGRLESIGLTNEELAMLQAIVLTFTDRSDLIRPDLVANIQENLIDGFEYLLRRNHGRNYWQFMMRTVDALIEARSLSKQNYEFSTNMALQWPEIQRSPLLLEISTMT